GTSQQNSVAMIREQDVTPYEQEFQTEVEREVTCAGQDYDTVKNYGNVQLCSINWGRIPFDVKLERIEVTDDTHKDLILNVNCNSKAPDPHWRCSFTVTVECNIQGLDDWESADQSITATRTVNSLVIPIMRWPEAADVMTAANLKIKIKMNSWAGNYPALIKSFTEKTDITDATLIVEGRHLYVTRAILALHSSYFHTLFFNHQFPDSTRREFFLDDIPFDDMVLFLNLIYPNATDDRIPNIGSANTIESMLMLAERFACDSVTRLMEKYLMEEIKGDIEGLTMARRLLISDRFRLSAPCSLLMGRLSNESALQRLGQTEEYNELSESMRAAILDMHVRRPSPSTDDSPRISFYESEWNKPLVARERTAHARRTETIERLRTRRLLDAQDPLPPPSFLNFIPISAAALPLLPRPPVAAVAAAAHSSVSPRDLSFSHFQTDVGRLAAAVGGFAMSSSQAEELDRAVQFLRDLSRSDYDATSSATRIPLHATVLTLVNSSNQGLSRDTLSASIDRFTTMVETMRLDRRRIMEKLLYGPGPNKRLRR
ncbi:hypothetical protein PENTCL1PPCAC_27307, partial [Pristionchus entomophagus]